jgi:uncharacterized membrane protein YcgQ (UPF0703/DUF1980 family)
MAMTCCEADMTFLGFMCKWQGAEEYRTKQWVKVRAEVGVEYQKDYHGALRQERGTCPGDQGRCTVLIQSASPAW